MKSQKDAIDRFFSETTQEIQRRRGVKKRGRRCFQARFVQGCLGLYLVTALLIFVRGRGTVTTFPLVSTIILVLGGPLLLASLVFLAVARHYQKASWRLYATRGIILSLCLWALMIPLWGAGRMIQSDVARAKTFCETLLPELHTMQTQTGVYPADLSKLDAYTNPPRIMRQGGVVYRVTSDGKHFRFTIHDGVTVAGRWVFTERHQEWQHWHAW